jgi:hypothetical protein
LATSSAMSTDRNRGTSNAPSQRGRSSRASCGERSRAAASTRPSRSASDASQPFLRGWRVARQ